MEFPLPPMRRAKFLSNLELPFADNGPEPSFDQFKEFHNERKHTKRIS